MALGNFDHIRRNTLIVRDRDGVTFSVSDFSDRMVRGQVATVLVLVELNEAGYTAGKRKLHLVDTPANRAAWSRA